MTIRSFFFWIHLVAGVCAGIIILIMSATGVLLTYERQILAWADSEYGSTVPPVRVPRVSLETLVRRAQAQHCDLQPTAITVKADEDAPVTIVAGRRTLYADAYSGTVLGEASRTGIRHGMSTLREWHRWLAMSDDQRAIGRAITGWANLIFLGIVCTGMYLWLPRRWTRQHLRGALFLRRGLSGKPRDFNWHNVIGIWSAVPLFFVVLTATPISFAWASALIYRAVGETPPAPAQAAARRAEAGGVSTVDVRGLQQAFTRAAQQVQGWRSIGVRLPAQKGAYAFTIDRGDGGQPQLRDIITITASGEVRWEPFASQSTARRLRSLARFTHTGEVLGLTGQTLAGLVSLGGVVLVWTGLALAWRRLAALVDLRTREARASAKNHDYLKLPHSSISEP